MEKEPIYQSDFNTLRCCVIIPTYNNSTTLSRVLYDVLQYTTNVLVVNDGSTDDTSSILKSFSELHVVTIAVNKGKGNALKTGFKSAEEFGYEYAVSMDSDGQHYPDDLPVFLEALKNREPNDPPLLVVGSREMDGPDIPEKSSIGNRFSSFWFWVETGVKLQDTQCGYRLYPLKVVNKMKLYTSRFELEIEVLVKAVWKGVKVINLPVKVLYDPKERVTHFRPFQDVARITVLNIWFLGVAFFYIWPRNILRKMKRSKTEAVSKETFSDNNLPVE
ncbi:glycosyltransferase family 2 protein [Salinimicrobium flavum]|uniref:Glycosyltransferase family 2 protein n=1 Tax=Salinimicrobium flavum TaxID=1737065 RepID=A0ABW5IYM9_9FLAO